MASLEDLLSEDELESIKSMRKKKKEEGDRIIKIRDGEREVEIPYSIGRNWLRKHGIELDDDAPEDQPEPEPEQEEEEKPQGTRFGGRRVS